MRGEKGSDAKQRLLQAAVEVFAERGFEHATVRDICGQAGLNVNAVKYYFEDKRTLYLAALQFANEELHRDHLVPPTAVEPGERLRQFVAATVQMVLSTSPQLKRHHQLIMRELTAQPRAPRRWSETSFNLALKA